MSPSSTTATMARAGVATLRAGDRTTVARATPRTVTTATANHPAATAASPSSRRTAMTAPPAATVVTAVISSRRPPPRASRSSPTAANTMTTRTTIVSHLADTRTMSNHGTTSLGHGVEDRPRAERPDQAQPGAQGQRDGPRSPCPVSDGIHGADDGDDEEDDAEEGDALEVADERPGMAIAEGAEEGAGAGSGNERERRVEQGLLVAPVGHDALRSSPPPPRRAAGAPSARPGRPRPRGTAGGATRRS